MKRKDLQHKINYITDAGLDVDGVFGKETGDAVKAFQQLFNENHIVMASLKDSPIGSESFTESYEEGNLEKIMVDRNVKLSVDGILGKNTERMINKILKVEASDYETHNPDFKYNYANAGFVNKMREKIKSKIVSPRAVEAASYKVCNSSSWKEEVEYLGVESCWSHQDFQKLVKNELEK